MARTHNPFALKKFGNVSESRILVLISIFISNFISYFNCQNLSKTFVETNCGVPRNHCFELGNVVLKTIKFLAV